MALKVKFDDAQLERLVTSIDNLSENLAKWQGDHAEAVKKGFGDLVQALVGGIGGDDDTQEQIDAHAIQVRTQREKLQTALNNQDKENK